MGNLCMTLLIGSERFVSTIFLFFIKFVILMVGLSSLHYVNRPLLFISIFHFWQQLRLRYLSRSMCSIKDLNISAFLEKCKVDLLNILMVQLTFDFVGN